MNTQQTNRMIAEYMGAEMPCHTKDPGGNITQCSLVYNGVRVNYIGEHSYPDSKPFMFDSSIEWLYPVARKVKEQLEALIPSAGKPSLLAKIHDCIHKINSAACKFEIKPLFESVVEAIEFLNKHKEDKQ